MALSKSSQGTYRHQNQNFFPLGRPHALPSPMETWEQHQRLARSQPQVNLHDLPNSYHVGRRILPLPGGGSLAGDSKSNSSSHGNSSSTSCSTSVTSSGQARPVKSSTVSRTAVKSGDASGELASPYSNHHHPLPPNQTQHHNNNIKRDGQESDTVRNVRMLLAKHRSVPDLHQQSMEQGDTTVDAGHIVQNPSLTSSATQSDPFLSSSAFPGDSFPATGQQLMAASLDQEIDDLDEDSEQELLRHLSQSQARMEQIKRMLVNQRGFIVQALKQLAESTTSERRSNGASCHNCSTQPEEIDPAERDRTIGSSMKYAAATKSLPKSQMNEEPEKLHEHVGGKLCPMCEAAFPDDIDEEIFESHVVEHFCYEDADTLKYVPLDELTP